MNFFMPDAKDAQEAEQLYDAVTESVAGPARRSILPYRIFRLSYRHDRSLYHAEVGKPELREGKRQREPVIAILEANDMYMICKPTRGVWNTPILVGKPALSVEYFEDYEPDPETSRADRD
jgi:hypothetical protein